MVVVVLVNEGRYRGLLSLCGGDVLVVSCLCSGGGQGQEK